MTKTKVKKKKRARVKVVAVTAVRPRVGGGGCCDGEDDGVSVVAAEGGERGAGVEEMVPCPVRSDPAMGDKTPEVMAWYREHAPMEYARRYGNRVCPDVGAMMMNEVCERGPVSDFEDEVDEVMVKPRVIMG